MGYPLASWTSQGRLANCWRAGTVPDLLRCKARRNLDERPSTGPRVRTLRKRRILPPGFLRKQFGLVPHPRPEHRSERPGSERGSNQSVRRQRTQRKPIRTTASTHFSDVHVCQRRNRDSPSNPHRASSSFTMRRTLSSGSVHPFLSVAPPTQEKHRSRVCVELARLAGLLGLVALIWAWHDEMITSDAWGTHLRNPRGVLGLCRGRSHRQRLQSGDEIRRHEQSRPVRSGHLASDKRPRR